MCLEESFDAEEYIYLISRICSNRLTAMFICVEQVAGQSTLDNIDNWRWRFTMLLRDDNDQELVSTDKKDRRDFEQLSALATRMGLHWYCVLSNIVYIIDSFCCCF